ncbi:MAG: hypothetical protein J5666_04460 [Bacilli bacterium]|nr:hypothetical protein [Bacilli bacterium]
MDLKLIKLRSLINSSDKELDVLSENYIKEIEKRCGHVFKNDGKHIFFLIESGGTEEIFIKIYKNYSAPYYLLTSGNSNSLAASIEILSFLKQNNLEGEIIHGDIDYVSNKINSLVMCKEALNTLKDTNLGVIGKPSDWLIASNVDYKLIKDKLGINLIDITSEELINEINKDQYDLNLFKKYESYWNNKEVLRRALVIHQALLNLKEKYNLKGLTIRCFDLLGLYKNTSCLSLAILNASGVTATCEGDIPSMITMHLIRVLTGKSSFQANPSRIDVNNNEILFAHCTLPLDMTTSYKFKTHFESGLGIGIKGELKEEDITVAKVSKDLNDIIVYEGKILKNLEEEKLCRTQIVVKLDEDISRLLKNPLGNHHIISYGRNKKLLTDFVTYISNK